MGKGHLVKVAASMHAIVVKCMASVSNVCVASSPGPSHVFNVKRRKGGGPGTRSHVMERDGERSNERGRRAVSRRVVPTQSRICHVIQASIMAKNAKSSLLASRHVRLPIHPCYSVNVPGHRNKPFFC